MCFIVRGSVLLLPHPDYEAMYSRHISTCFKKEEANVAL